MPVDPKHATLQALLQDRKTSTKGRPSMRLSICLDAELPMAVAVAQQELVIAEAAVTAAEAGADKRSGGKAPIDPELAKRKKAAEKAVADAEAAVDAASVTVTFTALKAHDYDELLKEHPPREGNELDAENDRNESTFPDALMLKSATKIEDADGNLVDMDIEELIGTLSDGERRVACNASNDANAQIFSLPFSAAKSQSRRRSGSGSNRR